MTGTSRLAELIDAHVSEPWPESVERGSEYGGVDLVMAGADIVGIAMSLMPARLRGEERAHLRTIAASLERVLDQLPAEARGYFLGLIDIAREAGR